MVENLVASSVMCDGNSIPSLLRFDTCTPDRPTPIYAQNVHLCYKRASLQVYSRPAFLSVDISPSSSIPFSRFSICNSSPHPYVSIPAYMDALVPFPYLFKPNRILTHLCLCFGFFEQIIYTYRPFFLLTLLHPSHSFLTELRTFMPRVC